MALFTAYQKKNLTELLAHAVNKDRVLTLTALHGFLFGLAITPEPILPNEWLPAIFGNEMLDIADQKEGGRLFTHLFSAYNKVIESHNAGTLSFPYDIPKLKGKDVPSVREWCYGFFSAIMLRSNIWRLNKVVEGISPKDDVIDVTTCTAIVIGVAIPEKILDLFKLSKVQALFADKKPAELEALLFSLLPTAITSMQKFAHAVKSGLTVPKPCKVMRPAEPLIATKIGRNSPCPCGSGQKYKKCCGK